MASESGDEGGRAPRRTPADTALVLDAMLGKLSTYLRMCGYDAAYALDPSARRAEGSSAEASDAQTESDDPRGRDADDRLLELARAENRLLVTRDAGLARCAGDAGLLLESKDVTDQLRELSDEGFELALSEPTRCSNCNAGLVGVERGDSTPEYAPPSDETRVWKCPECGQHFWKGSHWDSVAETLPN
ncbi:Mut7-C RNAse domain-containing protein [Halorussus salilacus]|uniref:Mut7-C RNAse domain-containing protein n=1 Tax=Halorussus salilacus TaxID=2953750 RepID=UPI00209D97F2|nr:Mut7-C RNAse domain-containing protein [Halorussus salilacus]USZ68930.1 Mut7-C RNAse domain-containing protein [Halorussus salilacus]